MNQNNSVEIGISLQKENASEDQGYNPDTLLKCGKNVTEVESDGKIFPSSKKALPSNVLTENKIVKDRKLSELPQVNQTHPVPQTSNTGKKESENELKLTITDVRTLTGINAFNGKCIYDCIVKSFISSPEIKVQVSFSDQNVSIVRL